MPSMAAVVAAAARIELDLHALLDGEHVTSE